VLMNIDVSIYSSQLVN